MIYIFIAAIFSAYIIALWIIIHHKRHIRNEADLIFQKTLLLKEITVSSMKQDIVSIVYIDLIPTLQEVHRIFRASDGNFYLYIHAPVSDPIIQVISEERANRATNKGRA